MIRLAIVIVVAIAVLALTWVHQDAVALAVGVAVGAVLFLIGVARGARLGNARGVTHKTPDVNARIGVALAAMGIAVEGIRLDSPYPGQFRAFCIGCQVVGAIIAVALAARYRARIDDMADRPRD